MVRQLRLVPVTHPGHARSGLFVLSTFHGIIWWPGGGVDSADLISLHIAKATQQISAYESTSPGDEEFYQSAYTISLDKAFFTSPWYR